MICPVCSTEYRPKNKLQRYCSSSCRSVGRPRAPARIRTARRWSTIADGHRRQVETISTIGMVAFCPDCGRSQLLYIILKPVLTEKSYDYLPVKTYTFVVDKHANKTEIRQAVEAVFGVQVDSVHTINRMGKMKRQGRTQGRRAATKKAYVKLKKDSKGIEFFDSMSQ